MMPGTGGTPPPPPGYQPPPLPGVAAGSVNIFRGRLVIVSGPTGAVVGVFVYQQGTTPQNGNPPIFWATSSGMDPFGNALSAIAGVSGTGAFQAGNTLVTPSGVLTYSALPPALGGLVSSLGVTAQFNDSAGNIVLPGNTSYATIGGGLSIANSEQGGILRTFLGTTGVSWSQIASINATSDGDVHYSATGGAHLVADTVWFALDPSTGVRGLWNDLRPLQNSFVGTIAGRYPPQYRLTPDGYVEVTGNVQLPAAYNGVTFANVPIGFRPAANEGHRWPVCDETNVAPVGTPNCAVDTSGNLQLHNLPAGCTGNTISIRGHYPVNGPITS